MVSKDKDTVAVDIGDGRKTWMSKEEAAKFKKNQEKSKGIDNKTDIPSPEAVKNMAVKGDIPKSLLDQMGTKDYWLSGVKGGAGDWDNRLFRLGEMMSYMGTPLSKRGDSPAKRWTTAHSASEKLKADLAKAQDKKKGFVGKLSPDDVGKDVMTRLKKLPWFKVAGIDIGSQYDEEELANFEALGKTKFMFWYDKTNDYEQAMEETLKELKLGI